MLFNSYIFIFIFLPLALLGWYGLNKLSHPSLAMAFLAGMSLWFYGYFNPSYLLIIVSSVLVNYYISFLLNKKYNSFVRKGIFVLGLLFNLGLLFAFKYYDFFIDNINIVFKTSFSLKHVLLPLGISFFTFQQLSFVIDRYRDNAKHYGFIKYLTFVTFFPQLVAGPIVLHDEIIPQFEDDKKKSFYYENFTKGIWLFSVGLSKKVLLADVIATIVNFGYENVGLWDTPSTLFLGIVYAFELYFDFSGYSDMAMGLGKMFNIDIPRNFDSPYKSCNVKQLWQKWHITLSRFFMQYVYIPLGGSRKGPLRTQINVFIIFLLSGIWHGANWTFVIWGVLQGIAVIWDNLYLIGVNEKDSKKKPGIVIPKVIGQFVTFNYFAATLYFFRSNSVSDAIQIFRNIFKFEVTGSFMRFLPYMDIPEIYIFKQVVNMVRPDLQNMLYGFVMVVYIAICIITICGKNTIEIIESDSIKKRTYIYGAILLVMSIISFSQVSTFIYFNF